MTDIIKVICENLGTEIDVPMGTPLSEVAKRLTPGRYPFLAAFVNNRLKELSYKIYAPVTIRFVDVTSFAGIRVYQRTAWFLLQKAVRDLYPGQTLHIRHSLGHSGFYCEIDGIDEFTADDAARLQGRMRELSVRNLPITRERMLTTEVRARYAEEGFTDKVALLDTRPRLYSQLYTLGDTVGYFYGHKERLWVETANLRPAIEQAPNDGRWSRKQLRAACGEKQNDTKWWEQRFPGWKMEKCIVLEPGGLHESPKREGTGWERLEPQCYVILRRREAAYQTAKPRT